MLPLLLRLVVVGFVCDDNDVDALCVWYRMLMSRLALALALALRLCGIYRAVVVS